MGVVPLEAVALVFAALISRALNRRPPLWEHLLAGLRAFPAPSARETALYIKSAAAHAKRFALTGELAQNAAEAADALLMERPRAIAYSHFPFGTFPWASVVMPEPVALTALAVVYAALTVLVGGTLVRRERCAAYCARQPAWHRTPQCLENARSGKAA